MKKLAQLQSFCSNILLQLDVLQKSMNEIHTTSQARYKHNFDKTFRSTPKFYSGPHVFGDRWSAKMTESSWIANARLTKLLSKTFNPLNVICNAQDSIAVDKYEIHNTVSTEKLILASYNVQSNDKAERDSNTQNESSLRNKDETYESKVRKSETPSTIKS